MVITHNAPVPRYGGSPIRVATTVASLAQDFDVHVLCMDTRDALIEPARQYCVSIGVTFHEEVEAFGFTIQHKLRRYLSHILGCVSQRAESWCLPSLPPHLVAMIESADLVWLFRQSPFSFRSVPRHLRGPLVCDVDDIEERVVDLHAEKSRFYRFVRTRKIRFCRRRVLQSATVALLCSDLDVSRFNAPCAVEVLPNTYPVAHHHAVSPTSADPTVLVLGVMGYIPNKVGVQWFLDEVWDTVRAAVPTARFVIAGRDSDEVFTSDPARGVSVRGWFDDAAPLLAEASVVVVPVPYGSGTRVKILEAFSSGLPVVSTSVGAEGLDVEHGSSILLADTAPEFADSVVRVLRDPALAQSLVDAGRTVFRTTYAPDIFAQRVLAIAHAAVQA